MEPNDHLKTEFAQTNKGRLFKKIWIVISVFIIAAASIGAYTYKQHLNNIKAQERAELQKKYNSYVQEGDKKLQDVEYSDAIAFYKKAKAIALNNADLQYCKDQIDFTHMLQKAVSLAEEEKYQKAIEEIQNAKSFLLNKSRVASIDMNLVEVLAEDFTSQKLQLEMATEDNNQLDKPDSNVSLLDASKYLIKDDKAEEDSQNGNISSTNQSGNQDANGVPYSERALGLTPDQFKEALNQAYSEVVSKLPGTFPGINLRITNSSINGSDGHNFAWPFTDSIYIVGDVKTEGNLKGTLSWVAVRTPLKGSNLEQTDMATVLSSALIKATGGDSEEVFQQLVDYYVNDENTSSQKYGTSNGITYVQLDREKTNYSFFMTSLQADSAN
jgi:hypothetical protein